MRDAGDIRIELKTASPKPDVSAETSSSRRHITWAIAAGMTVTALLLLWLSSRQSPERVIRLSVPLPSGFEIVAERSSAIAIDSAGKRLAFTASTPGGTRQLFMRDLGSFDVRAMEGTENALTPFFSPDGMWLGFFAGGRLWKVAVNGGRPIALCDTPAFVSVGAAWGADGAIVFTGGSSSGLYRVPEDGGKAEILTSLEASRGETAHRWPQILDDSGDVLFTVRDPSGWQLARLSLSTGDMFRFSNIGEAVGAQYLSAGYLVYFQAGGLFVTPFYPKRAALAHAPVRVVDGVYLRLGMRGRFFAVSRTGDLVYASGDSDNTLVWVDRSGRETEVPQASGRFTLPRLSPDDARVSVSDKVTRRAMVLDLGNGARTRLPISSSVAVWSPDGTNVALSLEQPDTDNTDQLHVTAADGTGSPEPLTPFEKERFPTAWSSDGRYLAFYERNPQTQRDIMVFDFDIGSVTPLLKTPDNERGGRFSPSGRWFVYVSNTSGQDEVFVRSFPQPGTRLAVSTDGGVEPVWSKDGREIFYRRGRAMMVASVQEGEALEIGDPAPLFESDHDMGPAGLPNYDVSADGQRFIMIGGVGRPREVRVILNWVDELDRLIPER